MRAIAPEELSTWLSVNAMVFHASRVIDQATDYHRERLDGDVSRVLAVFDGQRLVGTYESFAAELTLPGSTCLTANAVTAVAVLPTHHRRGALTSMLNYDLRAARERGEAISILIAAEYPIYGRFGFGPATHQAAYRLETAHADLSANASACGSVNLLEARDLRALAPTIFETFRHATPGQIDRRPFNWDTRLGLRAAPWRSADQQPLRCALYTGASGEPEGYVVYRADGDWLQQVPIGKLHIEELTTITPSAYLGLWRYLVEVDLISEITVNMRTLDEPLAWMLTNPRQALRQTMRADLLWARPLDTPRVLEARRYAREERLVLDVEDPLGMAGGRFELEAGPFGARCRATSAAPDVSLSMSALGAISLGGVSLHVLHAAGRIQEERPGALDRAERVFHWPITPWCSTFF
jgi:predicted acetyltransferase